jgi:RHS repeat-associated protein
VQEKRVGDITQLITGPGIDDYLSRITTTIGATPTTTTRNYLTDFLGSTTALADDAGAIKTTYGYEPYGEATSTGEATVNSFQYTGRENDGIGLYYYRARYYSPKSKRFISEDPIGQKGGLNTYRYVKNNPLLYTDALGLKEFTQCETQAFLDQARKDMSSNKISNMFKNHQANGTFDFKYNKRGDTFALNGKSYSASDFGNFIAGYSGIYFGFGGHQGVRFFGILYDYVDGESNWDKDSIESINAGAYLAQDELKGWSMPPCNPTPKPEPLPCGP